MCNILMQDANLIATNDISIWMQMEEKNNNDYNNTLEQMNFRMEIFHLQAVSIKLLNINKR